MHFLKQLNLFLPKKERNGISFLVVVGLLIFAYGYYEKMQLNSRGRFTIGKKTKYSPGISRSGVSHFAYSYKGRSYDYSIRDGGSTDSFVFVHFLPDNPKVSRIVSGFKVYNSCKKNNFAVPDSGWERLPQECCD